MKKIILTLTFVSSLMVAEAQLFLENHTPGDIVENVSGATITKSSNEGMTEIIVYVKLTSGAENYSIRRVKMNPGVNLTWTDQICWGNSEGLGLCTPAFGNIFNTDGYPITSTVFGEAKFAVTPVTAGGTGLYRYFVINTANNQKVDSLDFLLTGNAGIKETKAASISVYPNPASDFLNISTGSVSEMNLKIMDVLGKVVYTDRISGNKKVDLDDFKNGVYIVSLAGNGEATHTRRVVVRK